ncbi:hypothetical protein KAJ41_02895 [Candidatus Parcubacteria bacterium]|nr:hypothetical protein [Candidatus Parcubacteria bacterium]
MCVSEVSEKEDLSSVDETSIACATCQGNGECTDGCGISKLVQPIISQVKECVGCCGTGDNCCGEE